MYRAQMSVVSDRKQNATEWFEQMQRLLTRNMLSTHWWMDLLQNHIYGTFKYKLVSLTRYIVIQRGLG